MTGPPPPEQGFLHLRGQFPRFVQAFAKLGGLARKWIVALLNICGSADFCLQRHTLPIEIVINNWADASR